MLNKQAFIKGYLSKIAADTNLNLKKAQDFLNRARANTPKPLPENPYEEFDNYKFRLHSMYMSPPEEGKTQSYLTGRVDEPIPSQLGDTGGKSYYRKDVQLSKSMPALSEAIKDATGEGHALTMADPGDWGYSSKYNTVFVPRPEDPQHYTLSGHELAHAKTPHKYFKGLGAKDLEDLSVPYLENELPAVAAEHLLGDMDARYKASVKAGDFKGALNLKLLKGAFNKHVGQMTGDPKNDYALVENFIKQLYAPGTKLNEMYNIKRQEWGAEKPIEESAVPRRNWLMRLLGIGRR